MRRREIFWFHTTTVVVAVMWIGAVWYLATGEYLHSIALMMFVHAMQNIDDN